MDALASEPAFKKDTPGAAAFACAGPVLDNKCVMTNLEWVIDGASLTTQYGIRYGLSDSLSSSTLCMLLIMFAAPFTHATVRAGHGLYMLTQHYSIYGM